MGIIIPEMQKIVEYEPGSPSSRLRIKLRRTRHGDDGEQVAGMTGSPTSVAQLFQIENTQFCFDNKYATLDYYEKTNNCPALI